MSRRITTDERIESVRRGLEAKRSRSSIAAELGISKNKLAGIISRWVHPAHPELKQRTAPPRKPKQPQRAWVKQPAPRAAPEPPPPAPPPPRLLLCQWPLNDGRPWLFCEAEAEPGTPYCAVHCQRAFQKWPLAA